MLLKAAGVGFYNISKFDFEQAEGRPEPPRRQPDLVHQGLLGQRARHHRAVQVRRADRQARRGESALPGRLAVRRRRPPPRDGPEPRHGLDLRGADPALRGSTRTRRPASTSRPREVIRLMVDLLFIEDDEALTQAGHRPHPLRPRLRNRRHAVRRRGVPARAEPRRRLEVFGQELNAESLRHLQVRHDDQGPEPREHRARQHASPRTGTRPRSSTTCSRIRRSAWSGRRSRRTIEDEHETQGFAGRFGPGLPRINDGSLLFLLHMISKMKPVDAKTGEGGSRIAIVFNGSPLFTGDAGSGESEIRQWIIENDWLEAIVALPDQLFYNTGHLHLRLDRHQPQAQGAPGQGAAHQRRRPVPEDAQVPRQQAQRAGQGAHRDDRSRSTATSRRARSPRSSTTRTSATDVSPSSDHSGSTSKSSPERIERFKEESAFAGARQDQEEGRGRRARRSKRAATLQERSWRASGSLERLRLTKSRDAFEKTARRARSTKAERATYPHRSGRRSCLRCRSATRPPRFVDDAKGTPRAGRRSARQRERAAQGRRRGLLQA